ncbi:hypothetical protein K8354_13270 [Polaribacter litorisediminis]|uniref:hypothetical protein n=1 Tax=Polaribacter litorisediminis TaxID=1908341 RepID=UPI001CC032F9|nr:hypothetical protein [Polaribacter litorisediminis]UAM97284.1 hypothetical protein K8354_13270 [Polaribacter litorisediminis]
MTLNKNNLSSHFNGIQFQNEQIILNKEKLIELKQKHIQNLTEKKQELEIKKAYGVFSITDSLNSNYSITTMHYVDFRWSSVKFAATVMYKSSVEEWQWQGDYFMRFSRCPYRYSLDVCSLMHDDYRDCFKEIKEKEQLNGLLSSTNVFSPDKPNFKIKVDCGRGLESLTTIRPISTEEPLKLDLSFID